MLVVFPQRTLYLIVHQRAKPPVYKGSESDPEREIPECTHDACSQLLIVQGRESAWPRHQVGIGGIEGNLGKSEQCRQNNVLCHRDSYAPDASKVAQAG